MGVNLWHPIVTNGDFVASLYGSAYSIVLHSSRNLLSSCRLTAVCLSSHSPPWTCSIGLASVEWTQWTGGGMATVPGR